MSLYNSRKVVKALKKNRIICALLLSVAMIFTLMPAAAFAAEEGSTASNAPEPVKGEGNKFRVSYEGWMEEDSDKGIPEGFEDFTRTYEYAKGIDLDGNVIPASSYDIEAETKSEMGWYEANIVFNDNFAEKGTYVDSLNYKLVKVSKANIKECKKTIKGLKSGKKYYVRMFAFRKITQDGDKIKMISADSKIKARKTK